MLAKEHYIRADRLCNANLSTYWCMSVWFSGRRARKRDMHCIITSEVHPAFFEKKNKNCIEEERHFLLYKKMHKNPHLLFVNERLQNNV